MQIKLFEIRDSGTFIPAMAIKLGARDGKDFYLLRRAGYGLNLGAYVLMAKLDGGNGPLTCDPYDWSSNTMRLAHNYVQAHFDELENGQVVDVQFIVGNSAAPKKSEQENETYPL